MSRALRIGLVAIALVAAVAGAGLLVRAPPVAPAAAARCPPGHSLDAHRSAEVWARLARVPEGESLLRGLSGTRPAMCFGSGESSVVRGEALLLVDARLGPEEAAARVGHLLSHVLQNDELDPEHPDATSDCRAFGQRALAAEERAHALEVRLLRALRQLRNERAPAGDVPDARAMAAAVTAAYVERCHRARDGGG